MRIFKNESAKQKVMRSYDELLGTWATDYEETDVDTAYGITHCIVCGNPANPPLMLFHGVGDNSAVMWALNMKELSERFYCIAIDTIGGPGKSVPGDRYDKSSFRQTDWIDQVIGYFGFESVNMAGVSNGGYMAYNYAAENPGKVARAVCMEGGIVTAPLKSMIRTLLLMFPEIVVPTDRNLLKVLRKMSAPGSDLFERHPLIAEHLILLMKSHNRQAMFAHKLEKYDPIKGAAVKDKLFFMLGEHKLNLNKEMLEILNEGAFSHKIISRAGHGINQEQPGVVNREIIRFLTAGMV